MGASARRILSVISARPGITFGELSAEARLSPGTVHYHVNGLRSREHIETRKAGTRTLLFVHGASPAGMQREVDELMRNETFRRLCELLVHHSDARGLIAASGLSQRVVYYHLRRLRMLGLLNCRSPTRYAGIAPTQELVRLVGMRDASSSGATL